MQGLLEILSSASEFDDLAIRPGEEEAVRKLLMHAAVAVDKPRYTDPHTKANALLQARMSSSDRDQHAAAHDVRVCSFKRREMAPLMACIGTLPPAADSCHPRQDSIDGRTS